jgi:hypothetical protein
VETCSTAAVTDSLNSQSASQEHERAHSSEPVPVVSALQEAVPKECPNSYRPTKLSAEAKDEDGNSEAKDAQGEMALELAALSTKNSRLGASKSGTPVMPTPTSIEGYADEVSSGEQSEVEEEEEQSAGTLQMENVTQGNNEDVTMSGPSSPCLTSPIDYFPPLILDWEEHKVLVKNPIEVSQEIIVAKRKNKLLYIYTEEYTFKWHKTVSEIVARALVGVKINETLTYNRGDKGTILRALKAQVTKNGGMYLLECINASTNEDL